ncbi:MAG: STAS domain-containing protein [Vicinamibacteria bacterium]
MNIETKTINGILTVRLLDRRLDAHSAPDLKVRLAAPLDAGPRHVVLNLADVDFVDSTGLSAILSLVKRLAPAGSVVLCGCREPIVALLRLTRLDRVLRVFPGEGEAVAGLAS